MNRRTILKSVTASIATMVAGHAPARSLHFLLEQKVKTYRAKLEDWAQSPEVIEMARKGRNKSDRALAAADWNSRAMPPEVARLLANDVSKKMLTLARDPAIGNLMLLNSAGDVLGSSTRPRDYNLASSLAFTEAMFTGTWNARRARIDPVLKREVVALSAPVIDRNREIGVLYLQLLAD